MCVYTDFFLSITYPILSNRIVSLRFAIDDTKHTDTILRLLCWLKLMLDHWNVVLNYGNRIASSSQLAFSLFTMVMVISGLYWRLNSTSFSFMSQKGDWYQVEFFDFPSSWIPFENVSFFNTGFYRTLLQLLHWMKGKQMVVKGKIDMWFWTDEAWNRCK